MNYSQNKEQEHILNYFGDFVGTFLSVGENDGTTFSNVRALALKNWRGVMIEPSPKAFAKLKELYREYNGQTKQFYIYPWAVSSHNGKKILHESGALCSAADIGLVSTFHPEEMDRFKKTVKYDPVEVQTYKWKTAFNRLTIKEFDFISADCEGDEMTFLPDMDLSKTRLICLEHNSNEQRKKEYLECTSKFGLSKIIYESAENILIARV